MIVSNLQFFFCFSLFVAHSCDSGIFVMKLMQSHDGDKQHLFKPVSTLFLTPISIFFQGSWVLKNTFTYLFKDQSFIF